MNKDETFLKHIFDEIDFLENQFKDIQFQDLMDDPVLQRTCLRSLEVIGEAAKSKILPPENQRFSTAN